jgi:predicted metal-dependent phosphoesterase TrpH
VRSKPEPLLCELHAHTRWSDGELSVRELVDLHGRLGYDVLCVTDHALREDREPDEASHVGPARLRGYLSEIEREGERAWSRYRLLLIPGLELTFDADEDDESAHVVALGLREHVAVEPPLDAVLARAGATGAALIAAHPDGGSGEPSGRSTRAFARRPDLRPLVHRFELFNRTTMFAWVAAAGLPAVATGDVHRVEHVDGWKTLLPCAQEPEAVLDYLRSPRPVYLARLESALSAVA